MVIQPAREANAGCKKQLKRQPAINQIMKSNAKSFYMEAIFKTLLVLIGLLIHASLFANDGKQPTSATVKGSVPVNYYQAFMISVAVLYGIYLFLRARRRKRNSKITE